MPDALRRLNLFRVALAIFLPGLHPVEACKTSYLRPLRYLQRLSEKPKCQVAASGEAATVVFSSLPIVKTVLVSKTGQLFCFAPDASRQGPHGLQAIQ